MFGFTGADSIEVLARKRGYMVEAQARWPFLTYFDASTIKNERQLVTMVKERCSRSQEDAEADVHQWMQNKRSMTPRDKRAHEQLARDYAEQIHFIRNARRRARATGIGHVSEPEGMDKASRGRGPSMAFDKHRNSPLPTPEEAPRQRDLGPFRLASLPRGRL